MRVLLQLALALSVQGKIQRRRRVHHKSQPAASSVGGWSYEMQNDGPGRTCVVVIVQLGCDIRNEIGNIAKTIRTVVDEVHDAGVIPGTLKLGLIRYGVKRNIKIDLTLIDGINYFEDVITDVVLKSVEDIQPMNNAHFIPAFYKAFDMFEEYRNFAQEQHDDQFAQCEEKLVYYITNGHLQCEDCICIAEFETPLAESIGKFNYDIDPAKVQILKKWRGTAGGLSGNNFLENICSDYLTERDNNCCLDMDSPSCVHNRQCERPDIISCSDENKLELFIRRDVLQPLPCYSMTPAVCVMRNKVISMFKLMEIQCRNQDVKLLVQSPNKVPCTYSKHPFENRRILTDNRFEDCYNPTVVDVLKNWQRGITFEKCMDIQAIATDKGVEIRDASLFTRFQAREPSCSAYDEASTIDSSVLNTAVTDAVADCLVQHSSNNKIDNCNSRQCDCDIWLKVAACDFQDPDICSKRPECCSKSGCCGPRGPTGGRGEPGPNGPRGADGSPGGAGAQGNCGPSGLKGNVGLNGPPGGDGPRGQAGVPGKNGNSGLPGRPGMGGKTGLPGFPGQAGASGEPGPAGRPGQGGRPGPRGLQGPSGPRGAQGSSGGPGRGIETEEYYRAYVQKLRATVMAKLNSCRQSGRACQDPLVKKLEGILQGAINDVCKCNCQLDSSSGMCPSLPFRSYAPVRNPIIDQCPSSGSNYPTTRPTYRPPTYRPPTVPSFTWKPVETPVPFVSSSDEDNSSIRFTQNGDSISDPSSSYDDPESDSFSDDEMDLFDENQWNEFNNIRRRKRVHS
ncbi:unnamed protein product [Oikopleura dioica]|uniref:VWFA domain-containing protein n=1 Tax=Oikopleura dioica TaxID=34765 RepID=E4WU36_OIKDI|nr:unnamed protein product [Oikopleura dioica]